MTINARRDEINGIGSVVRERVRARDLFLSHQFVMVKTRVFLLRFILFTHLFCAGKKKLISHNTNVIDSLLVFSSLSTRLTEKFYNKHFCFGIQAIPIQLKY